MKGIAGDAMEPDFQIKQHLTFSYVTRAELLASFDDDAAFVKEIVDAFLCRCPLLLEQIRSSFHKGDAGAVSFAAHSLKGCIGYFAHGDVYEAAHRIELLTGAELPRLPGLLMALEQVLGDLTGYLERGFQSDRAGFSK
jgi:HPt (histidine-containing phosphotransfer) domain-containing protein